MKKLFIFITGLTAALITTAQSNNYFINKTASPSVVQSGQTVTYTIGYSTAAAVTGLVITETVPPDFTITSASKVYTQLGNILTFNVGGFAGGYSTITITGTFACGITCDNTFVIDTATINATSLPTKTDTAGVTITATNPWKIKKIPLTYNSGGTYYGALGGVVRYLVIIYKNTWCWGCAGELNLNGAQMIDNIGPNAQLVNIYDQSMNPVAYVPVGTTYTVNTGTLLANAGLNYYLYAPTNTGYCYAKMYYVDIKYPCNAGFVNGQTVSNIATLSGTLPCKTQPISISDTAKVKLADPTASGNFGKTNYIHYTPGSQIPGCSSSYNIGLNNNGSVPLTNINIIDTFPKQLDITSLYISSSYYPVNLFYWKQNGCAAPTGPFTYSGNPVNTATNITKAMLVTGGDHIYAIKLTSNFLTMGGNANIAINYSILNTDWCGGNVIPGTLVSNCANTSYSGNYTLIDSLGCVFSNNVYHGIINQTSCDTFLIGNPQPNLYLYKWVCTNKNCYKPGDTVRYHLAFNNYGSGPLSAGALLKDVLPTGLSYAGNESWYSLTYLTTGCTTGTPVTGVTANHAGNNLQWTLPAGLAGSCGNPNPQYWNADFDVVVNNNAAAGSLSNSYQVSGGGLATIKYSSQATINICPLDSLIAEKQVSIDGGITWQQNVTVIPGGTAKFRLKIRNVGTVPITNIKIVDILPAVGDIGVVSCTARGSQYNVDLNGALVVPSGASIDYSSQINPCRATDLCSTTNCAGCTAPGWTPVYSPAARSFRMNYGSFILNPNQVLTYDFDAKVPLTATKGQSACNSFGYCATRTNNNINTLAAENYPYACITVGEDTLCNCNGSHWSDITMLNAGQYIILKCGGSYALKCSTSVTITATYQCTGQHCQGSVQYKLKEPNGNIIPSNTPITFIASQPGTYTLTLYGLCGTKICDSCIITFKTDCKNDGCNCDGSSWGHITLSWNGIIDHGNPADPGNKKIFTSDGTGKIDPKVIIAEQQSVNIDCNADNSPQTLPCNKTFTITGTFNCSKAGCAKLLYNLVYPNGNTNSGTLGTLSFTTSQTGTYSITFYGMCGNDTCKICVYRFTVDCGGGSKPCPCPYNITIKQPSVQTSTLANPAATIVASSFGISGPSGNLFTEIRAEVISYGLFSNSDKECLGCKSYPFTWASIYKADPIGAMLPKITMFSGNVSSFNPAGNGIWKNPREVIWNNGAIPFAIPSNINMQFLLPPSSIIDCCELTAKICVKFTFRDINCRECEVVVCFDVVIKKK